MSSAATRTEPSSDNNVTLYAVIGVLAVALMTFIVIAVVIYVRKRKRSQQKQSEQTDTNQYVTPARELPLSSEQSNSTYTGLSPAAQTGEYTEIGVSTTATVPVANICDYEMVDVNVGKSDVTYENEKKLYENIATPLSVSRPN